MTPEQLKKPKRIRPGLYSYKGFIIEDLHQWGYASKDHRWYITHINQTVSCNAFKTLSLCKVWIDIAGKKEKNK